MIQSPHAAVFEMGAVAVRGVDRFGSVGSSVDAGLKNFEQALAEHGKSVAGLPSRSLSPGTPTTLPLVTSAKEPRMNTVIPKAGLVARGPTADRSMSSETLRAPQAASLTATPEPVVGDLQLVNRDLQSVNLERRSREHAKVSEASAVTVATDVVDESSLVKESLTTVTAGKAGSHIAQPAAPTVKAVGAKTQPKAHEEQAAPLPVESSSDPCAGMALTPVMVVRTPAIEPNVAKPPGTLKPDESGTLIEVKRVTTSVGTVAKAAERVGQRVAAHASFEEVAAKHEGSAVIAPVIAKEPESNAPAVPAEKVNRLAEVTMHAVDHVVESAASSSHVVATDRSSPLHEAAAERVASRTGAEAEPEGAYGATDPAAGRTLVATANVLEVGIGSGAHGWLRVRAELGHTGEVTASLVASSAGAAESLHKQIGAMSEYLKTASVEVSSLAVTAPEKNGGAQSAATYNAGAGEGSGTDGSGRERRGDARATPEKSGVVGFGDAGIPLFQAEGALVPWAAPGGGSGGWLSVRV